MKTENAFRTVAEALHDAKVAMKPAIADLASINEDYYFDQLIRLYLTLTTQERKAQRLFSEAFGHIQDGVYD